MGSFSSFIINLILSYPLSEYYYQSQSQSIHFPEKKK